ncbi:hypothetical protein [Methylocystis sp. S23]
MEIDQGKMDMTEINTKDIAKVIAEARQEVKGVKGVEPFLGTDADLVEAYEQHKEWQKINQLDSLSYVPEPFRKKQLRLVSAGALLDADVPPRKLMLGPWFKRNRCFQATCLRATGCA